MSTTNGRPFLRIAATYPTTDDARLPDQVEVELDVNDVHDDDEGKGEVDGDGLSAGFTGFVVEIVKALGGIATKGAATKGAATINVFTPGRWGVTEEMLADIFGHAPGCDGTCDQRAGQSTDPAASEPLPAVEQPGSQAASANKTWVDPAGEALPEAGPVPAADGEKGDA